MLSRSTVQFYFSFNGRVVKRDFWVRMIVPLSLLPVVLYGINLIIPLDANFALQVFVSTICMAAVWSFLAVSTKRCHDRGKSGKFLFVLLVPLVGWIWVFLELSLGPTRTGPNPYGDDPQWH